MPASAKVSSYSPGESRNSSASKGRGALPKWKSSAAKDLRPESVTNAAMCQKTWAGSGARSPKRSTPEPAACRAAITGAQAQKVPRSELSPDYFFPVFELEAAFEGS